MLSRVYPAVYLAFQFLQLSATNDYLLPPLAINRYSLTGTPTHTHTQTHTTHGQAAGEKLGSVCLRAPVGERGGLSNPGNRPMCACADITMFDNIVFLTIPTVSQRAYI